MNNKLRVLFALYMAMFLFSCNPMKKDVMKDNADNMLETVIAKSGNENFLVMKEEIFQATSKSDKNGFRQITGYTEYRISSYNLNTGNISKRIVLGDRKDNECTFLGMTEGMLWYKSVEPTIGFHARDPKTLGIIVTEDKIIAENPFLKDNLSKPEWNSITNYYGFDIDKNMPMVTDNSGFVYYIDPVTLKAEKTAESIKNFKYDNDCLTNSINTDPDDNIFLSGNPRSFVRMYSKELKDVNFLKGEFLQSSNMMTLEQSNPEYLKPLKSEIDKLTKQIDSISIFINGANTTSADKSDGWNVKRKIENAERNIEYAKQNIENIREDIKRKEEDESFTIITKDNSVFVLSQTDVTDKAHIIISKVRLNKDTTVNVEWQTELKNFYRDPDKGFDKSSFDIVFSKGDPELKTMRVVSSDDKLIFAFMLKVVCINISDGHIIWEKDL